MMSTTFDYEAINCEGAETSGTIDAEDLSDALAKLNLLGLKPYRATVAKPKSWTIFAPAIPNTQWRMRFFSQLATYLGAGIPMARVLSLIAANEPQSGKKVLITSISNDVTAGMSLSSAMAKLEKVFQVDEIGQVRAGEQTGSLILVLSKLEADLGRRVDLRRKLSSALVYPAFLLVLAPVSLIIIATILVPNLAPLFENSGAQMPFSLSVMIWFTDQFHDHGVYWALVGGAIILFLLRFSKSQRMNAVLDAVGSRLPVVRMLRSKASVVRICNTLSALIQSGMPLQASMKLTTDIMKQAGTRSQMEEAAGRITAGEKLGSAFRTISAFDSTHLQMVAIGEETNQLAMVLRKIADTEEKTILAYVDRMMTLLTPVITILLGLLVGGIIMSIMRAILSINQLVSP